MSSHGSLKLHEREEAVSLDLDSWLKVVPPHVPNSAIDDYFECTDGLKAKIIASEAVDAELLGLLTIGVISAVEFYLRTIFSRVPDICPFAQRHMEMTAVAAGAAAYYSNSGIPYLLSLFDHESLANGEKIKTTCKKCVGLNLMDDGSVQKVIEDFEKLCELRHCLVHARGYVGLKASNALELEARTPKKVLLDRAGVLEVLKIAHNVVRAVNRFLADGIANRWVDRNYLTGVWHDDKDRFTRLFSSFSRRGRDEYGGVAYKAYRPFQKSARAKRSAVIAST